MRRQPRGMPGASHRGPCGIGRIALAAQQLTDYAFCTGARGPAARRRHPHGDGCASPDILPVRYGHHFLDVFSNNRSFQPPHTQRVHCLLIIGSGI